MDQIYFYLLIGLLALSEILPFLKFLFPRLKHVNGVIILAFYLLYILYNVCSGKYYREYRDRKENDKQEQLKRVISEIILKQESYRNVALDNKVNDIQNQVKLISDIIA